MRPSRASASVLGAALLAALVLGGCPGGSNVEYIEGGVDTGVSVGGPGSVEVLTPGSPLLITGGTQVEVNWRASVPSRFSVFNVLVDPDSSDPNSGNEISAFESLPLTTSTVLVDTTRLQRGTYNVAVVIEELGQIVAYDYAPGAITIDQRPTLFFSSPRESLQFDRDARINPTINVAWTLEDPDSTNTVDIYLDPDDSPNGNEILLFQSANAAGDSFTFDLPTAQFAAGEYRILASIRSGRDVVSIYAPAVIRLLSRLSGVVDLRQLDDPAAEIRGAIFEGFNPADNAGSLVTEVPDVDGDGFDDFLIMAQFGKPRFGANTQRTGVGEGYLVYGRQQRFSGQINLNSIGTLVRGEVYTGVIEVPNPIRPSRGVTSFAILSDWDNDGIRDFAFGVPFTDSVPVSEADSPGYFRTGGVVVGSSQSLTGFGGGRVINIGDFGVFTRVDEDQPATVLCPRGFVGPKAPAPGTGYAGFYADVPIGITEARWLGARFSTNEFGDQTGETVAAYRCNGFADTCGLVITAPSRNPNTNISTRPDLPAAGVVSIYFRPAAFNPWNLGDGLIPIEGPFLYIVDDIRFDSQSGVALSPGFIIGNLSPPCLGSVNPLTWPESRNTARFYGGFAGARLTDCVPIGDLNADGIQDLIFGSPLSDNSAGSAFIVFGRLEGLLLQEEIGGELNIEEIGLPVAPGQRLFDGVRIVGAPGERLGQAQADAGDFNGDGLRDVVLGSPFSAGRAGGFAVFYGSRTVINLTEREIPYAELPARGLGVVFVGETAGDLAGARVASAGDVDRDGFDDLLIAAPNRSVFADVDSDGIVDINRTECGVVYLVYGGPNFERRTTPGGDPGVLDLRYIGTEYLPGAVFIGRNSGDQLGAGLGEQGDRSQGIGLAGDVDGDGQSDFMLSSVRASPRDRLRAGETYLIYGVGE